jgi:3-phenylpropionate/trans-cinnamate dioxygenase ferredoxin component
MNMKLKVGKVNSVIENKFFKISTRDTEICLTKIGSDIYAFEDICSHDGESISEGKLENNCIVCPRHLAKFDLKTGEALCMPATEPIRIFPVRIVGDEIELEMEDF